jgi:hypothetical protein
MAIPVLGLDENPLLHQMFVDFAPARIFYLQIIFILFVIVSVFYSVKKSKRVVFQPAFWVVLGWTFIYSLPSVVFAGNILRGLESPFYFFFVLFFPPAVLSVWLNILSRRLVGRLDPISPSGNADFLPLVILGIVACSIVFYWLYRVPFECTAGWSLIFDPERMLLAREIAGKLVVEPGTSRLIGAFVNVIAPLLIFVYLNKIYSLAQRGGQYSITGAAFLSLVVVASYAAILITGTKGSLIPTLGTCLVGFLLMPAGWGRKLIAVALVLVFFLGSIAYLQAVTTTERTGPRYQAGACVARFNVCSQGARLIESASARGTRGILGSPDGLQPIIQDFKNFCGVEIKNTKSESSQSVIVESHGGGWDALVTRAFKVPLQVASWYYLWVLNNGEIGLNSVPIISRINGSENIAKDVYKNYGTIYSGGDLTSTSTAPTSFLIAYPILMGPFGFFVSILFLLVFDGFFAFALRWAPGVYLYAFSGLSAAVSYHFLNADFFTVLGSHGGLALSVIVFLVAMRFRFFGNTRRFSEGGARGQAN